MKHHMNEARLALYLHGDLADAERWAVARHVEACPECQNTLDDLSQSHELLVGSFEEPTPNELAALRGAVVARMRTHRRGQDWRIWTFAAPAVVAMVILLANLRLQTQSPPPRVAPPAVPPVAMKLSQPPPAIARKIEIARVRRKRLAPGARAVTLLTRTEQPAWLKIKTSDPDVVVLWQLNENEKAETP